MKTKAVTMVRIYLTEGDRQSRRLVERLHDQEKLRGVTVFRGISGFGETGEVHGAGLVDLSLNLPVVVEFFDEPAKVDTVVEHLATMIKPGHMVMWDARVNDD